MYFACHSVIDVHGEDAVLPTLGHGADVDVTGPDYTPEEGFTWNGSVGMPLTDMFPAAALMHGNYPVYYLSLIHI